MFITHYVNINMPLLAWYEGLQREASLFLGYAKGTDPTFSMCIDNDELSKTELYKGSL